MTSHFYTAHIKHTAKCDSEENGKSKIVNNAQNKKIGHKDNFKRLMIKLSVLTSTKQTTQATRFWMSNHCLKAEIPVHADKLLK